MKYLAIAAFVCLAAAQNTSVIVDQQLKLSTAAQPGSVLIVGPDGFTLTPGFFIQDASIIPARISAVATLTFPAIASGCNEQPIPLDGATTGDEVFVGAPANIDQGFVWSGYVSIADTVRVRLCRVVPGAAIVPVVGDWRATIVRSQ